MLSRQFFDCGPGVRIAFCQPGKREIFFRVMKAIRIVRHVVEDIEHQVIIRPLSTVKQSNLCFQQVKQLRKIDVLLLQLIDVVDHDGHLKSLLQNIR